MNDCTNLDGKTRFGQIRELYNQDKDANSKVTLEMLAEKYHISASTLSRVEKGKSEPSASMLRAYSAFFGVTPGYLLGMDENEDMKATTVIKELGLTDATVATLREIATSYQYLTAIVNAFLGNGKYTYIFFYSLLSDLKEDNIDTINQMSFFLFERYKNYISCIVKPQLSSVLEQLRKEDEYFASILRKENEYDFASIPDEIRYADSPGYYERP